MALEMRTQCERCHAPLALNSDACICSYECTFCAACADALDNKCPNCGGELVDRPRRRTKGEETIELRDLKVIRRFSNLSEALLAKGCLDSSGIECYLIDDNMVRLDWFMTNVVGGIKLVVKPEDVKSAIAFLAQVDESGPKLVPRGPGKSD